MVVTKMTNNKLRPTYYQNTNGKDLFYFFANGLMNEEEYGGFLKGNIFKYITRYQDKNGTEDLNKARTYLDELINFETKKSGIK